MLRGDARQLERQLGQRSPMEYNHAAGGVHRSFVRAVLALIEAVAGQHKCLLLDLAEVGVISLDEEVARTLSGKSGHLFLRKTIQAVYSVAADVFEQTIDLGGDGWLALESATEIRNRITHPKSVEQCQVRWPDLDVVKNVESWFRDVLKGGFVRAVEQCLGLDRSQSRSAQGSS